MGNFNDFIYDIPVRIYFGRDQLKHLGAELKKYGTRVLMTYGGGSIKKMGLYDRVVKEIKDAGLELHELSGIEPNPRIGSVRRGVQMCKEHHIDVLLAVGGGSIPRQAARGGERPFRGGPLRERGEVNCTGGRRTTCRQN